MIIESSDQVPRATLLKRFPVPRNFGVAPESRIEREKAPFRARSHLDRFTPMNGHVLRWSARLSRANTGIRAGNHLPPMI